MRTIDFWEEAPPSHIKSRLNRTSAPTFRLKETTLPKSNATALTASPGAHLTRDPYPHWLPTLDPSTDKKIHAPRRICVRMAPAAKPRPSLRRPSAGHARGHPHSASIVWTSALSRMRAWTSPPIRLGFHHGRGRKGVRNSVEMTTANPE
jgi:hypothetical protein